MILLYSERMVSLSWLTYRIKSFIQVMPSCLQTNQLEYSVLTSRMLNPADWSPYIILSRPVWTIFIWSAYILYVRIEVLKTMWFKVKITIIII
jgi:hypothetical protein